MRESRWESELSLQIAFARLPIPVREYRFAPPRRFRFDFSWPEKLVGLEVDGAIWTGGRHARGAGIESDCEKFSIAAANGWRVLRIAPSQIKSGVALNWIEQALNHAQK